MDLNTVCVYCSASASVPDWLKDEAAKFGSGIAARGWKLIYGGASVGVMGALANAVLAAGGSVVGVIPKALMSREVAHGGLTELAVVETMHERKNLMFQQADAFVALPGGFGTMDELFEMITWKQLGIHNKPIVLLNARGYFDSLLAQFERGIADGLIRPEFRDLYKVADTVEKIFGVLTEAQIMARTTGKWY